MSRVDENWGVSRVPKLNQVWEVDMSNQYGSIHAIVLVLPQLSVEHDGYSGLNLLNGERIRFFMSYEHELPENWHRIA